jgi:catechol 2,3-dioxygenase-like lactoylglutathione lyase family enzyme
MITHVKFISIATRNQDLALAFYTEKLGFKLVTDQPHDEKQRWIELRIGGSDTKVVLFTMDDSRIGSFAATFACDNVAKTYQELRDRGVSFKTPLTEEPWGSFAVFEDVDGNQLMLSSK